MASTALQILGLLLDLATLHHNYGHADYLVYQEIDNLMLLVPMSQRFMSKPHSFLMDLIVTL